jgi:hypothetical protein
MKKEHRRDVQANEDRAYIPAAHIVTAIGRKHDHKLGKAQHYKNGNYDTVSALKHDHHHKAGKGTSYFSSIAKMLRADSRFMVLNPSISQQESVCCRGTDHQRRGGQYRGK